MAPKKNLYRHPDRQRPSLISLNKLHDPWALGIILLETRSDPGCSKAVSTCLLEDFDCQASMATTVPFHFYINATHTRSTPRRLTELREEEEEETRGPPSRVGNHPRKYAQPSTPSTALPLPLALTEDLSLDEPCVAEATPISASALSEASCFPALSALSSSRPPRFALVALSLSLPLLLRLHHALVDSRPQTRHEKGKRTFRRAHRFANLAKALVLTLSYKTLGSFLRAEISTWVDTMVSCALAVGIYCI